MSVSAPCETREMESEPAAPEPSSPSNNPRKGVPEKWLVRVGPESRAMQARTVRSSTCDRQLTLLAAAINFLSQSAAHEHMFSARTLPARAAAHAMRGLQTAIELTQRPLSTGRPRTLGASLWSLCYWPIAFALALCGSRDGHLRDGKEDVLQTISRITGLPLKVQRI